MSCTVLDEPGSLAVLRLVDCFHEPSSCPSSGEPSVDKLRPVPTADAFDRERRDARASTHEVTPAFPLFRPPAARSSSLGVRRGSHSRFWFEKAVQEDRIFVG